jgi:hypothetical protein
MAASSFSPIRIRDKSERDNVNRLTGSMSTRVVTVAVP